jgi:hypothetical protein
MYGNRYVMYGKWKCWEKEMSVKGTPRISEMDSNFLQLQKTSGIVTSVPQWSLRCCIHLPGVFFGPFPFQPTRPANRPRRLRLGGGAARQPRLRHRLRQWRRADAVHHRRRQRLVVGRRRLRQARPRRQRRLQGADEDRVACRPRRRQGRVRLAVFSRAHAIGQRLHMVLGVCYSVMCTTKLGLQYNLYDLICVETFLISIS